MALCSLAKKSQPSPRLQAIRCAGPHPGAMPIAARSSVFGPKGGRQHGQRGRWAAAERGPGHRSDQFTPIPLAELSRWGMLHARIEAINSSMFLCAAASKHTPCGAAVRQSVRQAQGMAVNCSLDFSFPVKRAPTLTGANCRSIKSRLHCMSAAPWSPCATRYAAAGACWHQVHIIEGIPRAFAAASTCLSRFGSIIVAVGLQGHRAANTGPQSLEGPQPRPVARSPDPADSSDAPVRGGTCCAASMRAAAPSLPHCHPPTRARPCAADTAVLLTMPPWASRAGSLAGMMNAVVVMVVTATALLGVGSAQDPGQAYCWGECRRLWCVHEINKAGQKPKTVSSLHAARQPVSSVYASRVRGLGQLLEVCSM